MDKIIEVLGADLREVLNFFSDREPGRDEVYRLRVAVDGESVKFKVNGGIWSPPLGHLDPTCEYALNRSRPAV
jgi:hypothetical protein